MRAHRIRTTVSILVCFSVMAGIGTLAVADVGPAVAARIRPPVPTSTTAGPGVGIVHTEGFEAEEGVGALVPDPGVSLARTADVARSGGWSLLVDGLTGYQQGVTLLVGPQRVPPGYYRMSAWVRLADVAGPEAAQIVGPSLVGPEDLSLTGVLVGAEDHRSVQPRPARLRGTGWSSTTIFLERRAGAEGPLAVRVRPVAYCDDSPAVPFPFHIDDVEVEYLGLEEPSLPQLAPMACPLVPPEDPAGDPVG